MRIWIELKMKIVFYHKSTMKELLIDNGIKRVYNEDSPEYAQLCEHYGSKIDFEKENNTMEWNKQLTAIMMGEMKESEKSTLDTIEKAALGCWTKGNNGYISMCGVTLNLKDFCAFKVIEFELKTGGEEGA